MRLDSPYIAVCRQVFHVTRSELRHTREVASWLGVAPVGCELIRKIDPRRAGTNQHLYTLQEVRLIQDLLAPLRTRLGYISLEASDRPAPSAPTPSVAWPFCNPLQALRDPLG